MQRISKYCRELKCSFPGTLLYDVVNGNKSALQFLLLYYLTALMLQFPVSYSFIETPQRRYLSL